MVGAKMFSILDANKGFYHIELEKESQLLTTFHAGKYGRYCYLVLPFGICSAPEVFQYNFQDVFKGLEGVTIFIDDILVFGKDKEEHRVRLNNVLKRTEEFNIKFNKDKCKFELNEVKYLDHIFSDQGLKVDPEKVNANLEIKEPKSKKELETILGIVTYVSKFLPNVSTVTDPLRQLLKKENEFVFYKSHKEAFAKLKKLLTEVPILQYFDVNKEITLSVDCSSYGAGAVLLQNNLPVAYASKALTNSQKTWAQIEKELLAIVLECDRFHHFIYGRTIKVETDHKPLEYIFKKSIN